MRVLTVSVLLFMVLADSVKSEDVNETQAELNVAGNGDVGPPAEEIVETVPDAPVLNPSLTESAELGDETPFTRYLWQCPFGWHGHQGRCYQYVNQAQTWINAQKYCMGLGANLVSARNPREYYFLQHMVRESGGTNLVWLGGFFLQTTWLWVDGEGFYYSNWYSPNTASSYPCILLRPTAGWSNSNCYSARYPFICVKRTC